MRPTGRPPLRHGTSGTMTTTTKLLLALASTLFVGCYSGAEDANDGASEDRYTKYCYSSYGSSRSASFASKSSANVNAEEGEDKASGTMTLTAKAGVSSDKYDQIKAFDELRYQAGQLASFHIAQTCWEADDISDSCKSTCEEQGLAWNEERVVCEDCEVLQDGSIKCGDASPFLLEALSQPWYGEKPWFFVDEEAQTQLMMFPPKLTEDDKGELVWIAEVEVVGFCVCACAPG